MTLFEICMEIASVENGLAFGEIQYTYDKLMCAMKPGHPADILDDIFCDVGNELFFDHDKEIPKQRVEKLYKDLQEFATAFGIKELDRAISELQKYIDKLN